MRDSASSIVALTAVRIPVCASSAPSRTAASRAETWFSMPAFELGARVPSRTPRAVSRTPPRRYRPGPRAASESRRAAVRPGSGSARPHRRDCSRPRTAPSRRRGGGPRPPRAPAAGAHRVELLTHLRARLLGALGQLALRLGPRVRRPGGLRLLLRPFLLHRPWHAGYPLTHGHQLHMLVGQSRAYVAGRAPPSADAGSFARDGRSR